MGASGGRSSRGPRLALLVALAALFALVPAAQASAEDFTLTVNVVPAEGGEVLCFVEPVPVDCEEAFEEGEEVTLNAEPELGFAFSSWGEGDCDEEPSEGECVVTMEANREVTVTFVLIENSLTIEHKGSGSGAVECEIEGVAEPCQLKYPEETLITLVAEPDPGSEFVGFGGDCEGAPEECELEMYEDRVAVVTFNHNGGGEEEPGGGGGPGDNSPTAEAPILVVYPGKARVAGASLYKGGRAMVRIVCKGPGSCAGKVKLFAKLKRGKGKARRVLIGKKSFRLTAGSARTVKIKLSRPAKKLLRKGRTVIARVGGPGVTGSKLRITPSAR